MAVIETFELEKSYQVGLWRKRERQALRPLTLAVEAGEIFGYLGPNGAGKTTTLKLLMGLIYPTAGSATILGRPLDDRAMKAQIGFLPEQPYFYDYLSARELLHYLATVSAVPAKERARRVDQVLERVGLQEHANVQLRKFSKGMLQRVGIAQAIVHDPKLIFLDEPMSGLDPIGRREVRDLIQSLKDEGKTVFFSTHILSDAETLCDRVAVLNNGQLRGIGVVADLAREISGKIEVIWDGIAALGAITGLGAETHSSGSAFRAVLPEAMLEQAVDVIRSTHSRLIAITPLRATLEDFFLQKLEADPEGKAARGGSAS
ncbi:MAG: ABC transporter ATP-binding protein [Candidatus Korobacteraceae bacterium]|jgi:ABC-2 type transport system ATP-binding protein